MERLSSQYNTRIQNQCQTLALLLVLLMVSASTSTASTIGPLTKTVETDPAKAVFVYDDVVNFLRAQESIRQGEQPAVALQRDYFDAASPGLQMFVAKYDLSVERLLKGMSDYPEHYERLEGTLAALRQSEGIFRDTYSDLQREIPFAVFPPTYYLVAGHRGIGSGSIEGPLISIEKKDPSTVQTDLPSTLVHEMVHMQQLAAVGEVYFDIFSGPERSLLALSIREGAATYFSQTITGGGPPQEPGLRFLSGERNRTLVAISVVNAGTRGR